MHVTPARLCLLMAMLALPGCSQPSTPDGGTGSVDAPAAPTCASIPGGCRCDPGAVLPGACGPDTGIGELVCCASAAGCDCQRRAYTGRWECRQFTAGTMAYCNCGEGAPTGGTPTATCTEEGNGPCRASVRGAFCECQPFSPSTGTVPVPSCTPMPAEVGSYDCPAGSTRAYACDGTIEHSCGQPGDSCSGDVDCCIPLCCGDILGCC